MRSAAAPATDEPVRPVSSPRPDRCASRRTPDALSPSLAWAGRCSGRRSPESGAPGRRPPRPSHTGPAGEHPFGIRRGSRSTPRAANVLSRALIGGEAHTRPPQRPDERSDLDRLLVPPFALAQTCWSSPSTTSSGRCRTPSPSGSSASWKPPAWTRARGRGGSRGATASYGLPRDAVSEHPSGVPVDRHVRVRRGRRAGLWPSPDERATRAEPHQGELGFGAEPRGRQSRRAVAWRSRCRPRTDRSECSEAWPVNNPTAPPWRAGCGRGRGCPGPRRAPRARRSRSGADPEVLCRGA